MADANAGPPAAMRVFVSYSHTPPENAEFARGVAARLRHAGFGVWLDEEEIPHGGDIEVHITKAARASDAGLFIVTKRWLERQRSYIRHEVSLFDRPGARRLAILREPADEDELGPHFATIKTMEWFPDDPQPYARLWEIYCGVLDKRPGSRVEWEENGRRIFGGNPATPPIILPEPPLAKPAPQRQQGVFELATSARPVGCISASGCTWLVTEQDEWAEIGNDDLPQPPIQVLSGYTATISGANELLVAGYDATVARLRGRKWEMITVESPILCFAGGVDGTIAGTASGAVIALDVSQKPLFRMRDPVAALARFEGGMLALGTRGTFGRVAWPAASQEILNWIAPGDLGRPVGFFPAMELNHVGVHSSTRIGVLAPDTENLALCPKVFEEGIRSVAFLGLQMWPYAVHTDAGNLFLVDASLTNTRAVKLPRRVTVTGCAGAGQTGAMLAWTNKGRLYRVSAQGLPDPIADRNVVMACCLTGADTALVVRWNEGQRVTVEKVRFD